MAASVDLFIGEDNHYAPTLLVNVVWQDGLASAVSKFPTRSAAMLYGKRQEIVLKSSFWSCLRQDSLVEGPTRRS